MAKQTEKKRAYLRRWRAENRDRIRVTERAWRAANPDRLKLMRARAMKSIVIEDATLLDRARGEFVERVMARTRDRSLS